MVSLVRISVIIPTYNRARTIRRSVESVLNQTYQDFEILIVDDGSTVETFKALKPLLQHPKVQYFRHDKNRGHQAARNTGIKHARGDYVAFLDSDDEWSPLKLELQLRALEDAPAKCAALTGLWKVANNAPAEEHLKKYNGYVFSEMLAAHGPTYSCLLVPRECFSKIGFLDERAIASGDWDTCISLARYYEFITVEDPCVIIHFGEPDSVTRNKLRSALGYLFVVEKNREDMLRFIGKRGLAKHYRSIALLFADAGEFLRCRAQLLKAFRLDEKNPETFLLAFSTLFGRNAFEFTRRRGTMVKRSLRSKLASV